MRAANTSLVAAAALGLLFVGVWPALADEAPSVDAARRSIERGLTFLQQDAVKWRQEHECATCHHGTLTVWALSEAKRQGYVIDGPSFADTVQWTKGRLKNIDHPRDTRPGPNMVNSLAVYLAVMAQAIPEQGAVSADELKQIAGHLMRHQEADGSWAWSIAPPKNRPPPFFESDEVVTLLACIGLRRHNRADSPELAESLDKAAAWLKANEPGDSTQAAVVRLFRDHQFGAESSKIQAGIDDLLKRQNADGGWSQLKELPSDAYATGQTLYFLSLAGVPSDRNEIRQAVSFLVASQKEDGSWPMTSRAHPGAEPYKNPVPITYFGSAWGTLGLLRSVPK